MSCRYFFFHKREKSQTLFLIEMHCLNRFSSWRQLIDFRHVEVAVLCHGEGTRYRSRRHDESMRWILCLFPETSTLSYAKTMLLIDNAESELLEFHSLFDESVCAYHNINVAVFECRQYILSFFLFGRTSQQRHCDFHVTEHLLDCLIMLCREYFCRCHQRCLKTIVEGEEHHHESHYRLAATHVTLQQPVHLESSLQVATNLLDDTFLCVGKRKRQMFVIEGIEIIAYIIEDNASCIQRPFFFIEKESQLEEEMLLIFKSCRGEMDIVAVLRQMYLLDSSLSRKLSVFHYQRSREVFWYHLPCLKYERLYYLGNLFRSKSCVTQFLSSIINTLQALPYNSVVRVIFFYVGMRERESIVEDVSLAEKEIFLSWDEFILYPFKTFKPDQFYGARLV